MSNGRHTLSLAVLGAATGALLSGACSGDDSAGTASKSATAAGLKTLSDIGCTFKTGFPSPL